MKSTAYVLLLTVYLVTTVFTVYWVGSSVLPSNDQAVDSESDGPATETKLRAKYIPFLRSASNNSANDTNSTCGDSSDDFPFLFTDDQLQKGGIVVIILIGIYCFTFLAIICDKYFLPCVGKICEALNLTYDVAAATFMSVATSCPELFANVIGTFITKSDIGIGTIVGSSLFNLLGVAALGGLWASKPIQLHWWPVTRDISIYIVAITLLIIITWDGIIKWYEALILFIVYFIYFIIMFQNARISRFVLNHTEKHEKKGEQQSSYEKQALAKYVEDDEEAENIYRIPEGSVWKKAFFFYTWPLKFCLSWMVPDPISSPKLFPITFILCIFLIGGNSYVVSWMISTIGHMFKIPDAVLGLTLLAAGSALPESINISLMSIKGSSAMGVSNSLGASTMNILLSLGMPWFLKIAAKGMNHKADIHIESGAIVYTIIALIPIAMLLYTTLFLNHFQLRRRVGLILITFYAICAVMAILSEMVFFDTDNCNDN